jgi:hypothetical protein
MKTLEEIAREYGKDDNSYEPEDDCFLADLAARSFVAGAKFAQRWISIEDERPDYNERVLVKNVHGEIYTHIFVDSSRRANIKQTAELMVITHWRPIELK